jgi:hypothetical protein
MSLAESPEIAFTVRLAVVSSGVAAWVHVLPFQFTAATTEPVSVASGAVPTAQTLLADTAGTAVRGA